jgi:ubiquitin-protein ligase
MNVEKWNKIIAKKIDKIKDDETFQIIRVKEDDNSKYLVMFKLNGGHYKDQLHIISLDLKREEKSPDKWFPAFPPKTYFVTKMFHTNVSPNSGWICLDVLQDKWSPMNNIDTLIQCIILLLDDPSPTGNHLNSEAAKLQQTCQNKFNKEAKHLKKLHGQEYDAIYNECFAPFDNTCIEKYAENKEIIKKYLPKFSRFNTI